MKIALVSPYDWCVHGGVNAHITHLASRFRAWGHDVTIFAPASDPAEARGECVVMGKPRQVPVSGSVARITFAWSSPQVKRVLHDGNFDLIHIHEPLMPLLPYHFLRYSDCATVGTFHAAKEGGNRMYRYTRPLTRRWFRKLDGKIAVSPAAVRLITRYFPGYYNVIPNGIDFEHFSRPRDPLTEFADGRPNILFVGRPEKRKGLKYLLRAYVRVLHAVPDARLIVVGAGDFRRYERAMAGVGEVIFRSHIPYPELPRYHASATVFCSPATGNESQGIALLEAMAAGVAVVASNIEGFAGVITDGVDGLLTKPKDDEALAEAIVHLLRDDAFRREIASHGQEQAVHYSWESIARRVLSYYERLVYERQQVAASRKLRAALGRH